MMLLSLQMYAGTMSLDEQTEEVMQVLTGLIYGK